LYHTLKNVKGIFKEKKETMAGQTQMQRVRKSERPETHAEAQMTFASGERDTLKNMSEVPKAIQNQEF
jgi:hypothetical protein